jgi:hypothetical protein
VSEKERIRRPVLDRTKPHRTWANVVSAVPAIDNQSSPEVQTWNRVLDDHLRAGQASARLVQEALGGISGSGASGSGASQDLVNRMVRAGSDFMSFWLEFMSRFAGGTSLPADRVGMGDGRPDAIAAGPVPGTPLRVTVEVDSARPTKVAVDLRPRARGSRLSLDRLHPRGSGGAPIRIAKIDSSPDTDIVVIALRITEDQLVGVYDGVIVDDVTGLAAGTLSIEVQGARAVAEEESYE